MTSRIDVKMSFAEDAYKISCVAFVTTTETSWTRTFYIKDHFKIDGRRKHAGSQLSLPMTRGWCKSRTSFRPFHQHRPTTHDALNAPVYCTYVQNGTYLPHAHALVQGTRDDEFLLRDANDVGDGVHVLWSQADALGARGNVVDLVGDEPTRE